VLAPVDIEFLKQVSLFAALGDPMMSRFCEHGERVDIAAGELLFEEGKPAKEVVVVIEGSLEVVKKGRNGREARVATLGRGDVVGEMSLVDIQPRSGTVRALENTTVVIFSHGDIAQVYRDDPPSYTLLLLNIAREISIRLRRMDTMLANITTEIAEVTGRHFER
jgi:CRP-like cAMP-binding protein